MVEKHNAFTLVELIVVITLIGVVTTVLLPRLFRRSPALEWSHVLDDMNNLIFFARQEAISNHKVYRLTFQSRPMGSDAIFVEEENDDPEKAGRKAYSPVSSYYLATTYSFAPQIKLKAVYLGRYEQLEAQRGLGHCYIVPDGLVQPILVHLVRKMDGVETVGSYKISPFFGKFEFYEGLVKPEK